MEIRRQSITWYLSGDAYVTGVYCNGDPWVMGPITITGIDPPSPASGITGTLVSSPTGQRYMNGSMVDPRAGEFVTQGFDSYMQEYNSALYRTNLNVARPNNLDLSESNPLVLNSGSLISTMSQRVIMQPMLRAASVLTIIPPGYPEPESGAFRPYYCGSGDATNNKYTKNWNFTGLNWTMLRNLVSPGGNPSFTTVANYFTGVWIEIDTNTNGRNMHPSYNEPDYGIDICNRSANGMLALHLNNTQQQKEILYPRVVQYGIDVFGAALAGGVWVGNGGYNPGRKMPMLFAGLALNDPKILASGFGTGHVIFAEDQQTFYVDAVETGTNIISDPDDNEYRQNYRLFSGEVLFTTGSNNYITWSGSIIFGNTPIKIYTTGVLPVPLSGNTEYLTAGSGQGITRLVKFDSGIWLSTSGVGPFTGIFNLLGAAEWGEKHATQRNRDAANWNAAYRDVNYRQWLGHYMSAKLTSTGQAAWGWNAYFDYMDRTFTINSSGDYDTFFYRMYTGYGDLGPVPPVSQYVYRRLGRFPKLKGLVYVG